MIPVNPSDQSLSKHFFEVSAAKLEHDFLPRLEAALSVLPEDSLWVREGPQTNSAGTILLHMAGNLRQWVISGVGGAADERIREAEFNATGGFTKADLFARISASVAESCDILRKAAETDVLTKRRIQIYDVTPLEATYHAVEHFSYHLGQVIHIAKRISGKDLRLYPF